MLVAPLFRHDGVPGDVLRGAVDRAAVVIHHADALLRQHGDVAVGEEKNFARVLQEGGNVAGHKKFSVAQTDYRRRSHSRGYNLMRVLR